MNTDTQAFQAPPSDAGIQLQGHPDTLMALAPCLHERPELSPICAARGPMPKVWIDLDNSPHVPFFAPIIEELERRRYEVVVTARDCFQVRELADLVALDYKLIGRHYGKRRVIKIAGLCVRACQMLPSIHRARPCIAISHGSRSQLIASKILGLPSVMIGDYEFAKLSAGIYPDWLIVPELVSNRFSSRPQTRIRSYPGIKEDVYASRFKPRWGVRAQLGLREDDLVVTIRPPASEAHYHVPESDRLFEEVMNLLSETPAVRVVMLPRNARQSQIIRESHAHMLNDGKMIIPSQAVDGLNLVWHSDLVISGGGTMNREAAALGVPVYSIFRGKIGAVDQHLARRGRLQLITSQCEVRARIKFTRRNRPDRPALCDSVALRTIVEHLVSIIEA